MKNLIKFFFTTLFLLAIVEQSSAQMTWKEHMNILKKSHWVFGIGWNVVDDDGKAFKKIFDVKNSWNIPAYPSSIRVEKYYMKGMSFVLKADFNQYKSVKLINSDVPLNLSSSFFSTDLALKYNLCALFDINTKLFHFEQDVFDIYTAGGFGYTYRNTPRVGSVGTFNLGFGMNSWIYEGFGINIEAMSKFGLTSPFFSTPSNYLQYNIGIVYMFKPGHGFRTIRSKLF